MNPFLLIAIGAGVWYAIARAKDDTPALPPAPPGPRPGVDSSSVGPLELANLEAWEYTDYSVDIFPADAPLASMRPPSYEGFAVGQGCVGVAVGHGFWAELEMRARPMLEAGTRYQAVTDQLVEDMLLREFLGQPSRFAKCLGDGTEPAMLLVAEIEKRIRFWSGPSLTAAPPDAQTAAPVHEWTVNGRQRRFRGRRARLVEALYWKATGRKR